MMEWQWNMLMLMGEKTFSLKLWNHFIDFIFPVEMSANLCCSKCAKICFSKCLQQSFFLTFCISS